MENIITKNNISFIDKVAHELYILAAKNDSRISAEYVDDVDGFVSWHNRDDKNMQFYYDNAKVEIIKQRKEKLKKIK